MNGPQREDADEPTPYKQDERPCPACRRAVSKEKIFSRAAFEPADEDLGVDLNLKSEEFDNDGDVKMFNIEAKATMPGRGVRKRKAAMKRVLDSDEERDADDMSDFIVESDENEDKKDARREMKRRLKGKGKQRAIVISDDEDDDIIYGAKPDVLTKGGPIKLMARFLPSTKMKVCIHFAVDVRHSSDAFRST